MILPTHNWADRLRLYGIDHDLATLFATNRNGNNNAAIAALTKARGELLDKLIAAGPFPPSPPMRVVLCYHEKTVVAIVENSGEASALFARWCFRHPGAGMIAQKVGA